MKEDDELSSNSTSSGIAFEQEEQPPEHKILIELIENLDQKREILRKIEAIEDIRQTSEKLKQKQIRLWADRLEKHPATIRNWLKRTDKEGLASIVRSVRSDSGVIKGNSRWKHSPEYWTEFIVSTYDRAKKAKLGITPNLVNNQVKAHAEQELGLQPGEYPCHMFVYKILNPILNKERQSVRNPGQGPGLIVKVTSGKGKGSKWIEEDIVVTGSNQVWQIDHTRLDNLLTNNEMELLGSVWITAVIDTWSGCVMGYYLSFDSAGSHEVALALRHAILPKQYGPEYKLQKQWEARGIPDYIVTDRAKEFKSAHLRHVASDLGIKLRLRLYTEQGGIVERLFLELKTEFAALISGFKGGNLEERPENAEKYACIVFEDYDRKLVRHFVDHHNQHLYPRVKDQNRLMRWQSGLHGFEPRMPENERKLDICLMKQAIRKVQKRGCVEFSSLVYTASVSRDETGAWQYDKEANFLRDYEGYEVTLRYDPSNIIYILVYTREKNGQPSEYLGKIRARDIQEERLSSREWEVRKAKIRKASKSVDQSSILAQQRDLYNDSLEQVKTLKGRRQQEQSRIKAKAKQSNVVKFPEASLQTRNQNNETVTSEVASSVVERVEFRDEQPKVHKVEPALFVVPDWNEFMDDDW